MPALQKRPILTVLLDRSKGGRSTSGGPYTQIATGKTVGLFRDSALTNGLSYYYVLTRVDGQGVESDYSHEVIGHPVYSVTPAPIKRLVVSREGLNVRLLWIGGTVQSTPSGPIETMTLEVYRGATPDFGPDTTGFINRIYSGVEEMHIDVGAISGPSNYYYKVTAVTNLGARNFNE